MVSWCVRVWGGGGLTCQTHGLAVTQKRYQTSLEIDLERLGRHVVNFLIFNLERYETVSDTEVDRHARADTRIHAKRKRQKRRDREGAREHLLSVSV